MGRTPPGSPARWVVHLARIGFAAKGLVYLVVGLLAIAVAVGLGGATTGSTGALRSVAGPPLGTLVLVVLAPGLGAHAVWRFVEAIVDPNRKGRDLEGLLTRLGYAITGASYAGLSWYAVRLLLASPGGGDAAERWAGRVLGAPFGRWLVGAVGLGIAIVALVQLRNALSWRLVRDLDLKKALPEQRRWIVRVGRFGDAVRSVVFGLTGGLVLRAALTYDPRAAGGLGDVLAALRGQPLSSLLLGVAGVGLTAYGCFQLVMARYRRIRLPSS